MYKENKEAVYQIIDTFHIHSPFKVYKTYTWCGTAGGFCTRVPQTWPITLFPLSAARPCFEHWNNWRCHWPWIGARSCKSIAGLFGEELRDNPRFLAATGADCLGTDCLGTDCLGRLKQASIDIARCLWRSWFLICRTLSRCVGREGVWIGAIPELGWDLVLLDVPGLWLDGQCLRAAVILLGVLGRNWKVSVDDFLGCSVSYT